MVENRLSHWITNGNPQLWSNLEFKFVPKPKGHCLQVPHRSAHVRQLLQGEREMQREKEREPNRTKRNGTELNGLEQKRTACEWKKISQTGSGWNPKSKN